MKDLLENVTAWIWMCYVTMYVYIVVHKAQDLWKHRSTAENDGRIEGVLKGMVKRIIDCFILYDITCTCEFIYQVLGTSHYSTPVGQEALASSELKTCVRCSR